MLISFVNHNKVERALAQGFASFQTPRNGRSTRWGTCCLRCNAWYNAWYFFPSRKPFYFPYFQKRRKPYGFINCVVMSPWLPQTNSGVGLMKQSRLRRINC